MLLPCKMKAPFLIFSLACALILICGGCSTPESVSKLEGKGNRHLFDAAYDPVWHAVLGAVEMNDLRVFDVNRETGHISARRVMGTTTFGENVSIWVRSVTPIETEVEVVSRRTGPPVLPVPSQEKTIIQNVAKILEV